MNQLEVTLLLELVYHHLRLQYGRENFDWRTATSLNIEDYQSWRCQIINFQAVLNFTSPTSAVPFLFQFRMTSDTQPWWYLNKNWKNASKHINLPQKKISFQFNFLSVIFFHDIKCKMIAYLSMAFWGKSHEKWKSNFHDILLSSSALSTLVKVIFGIKHLQIASNVACTRK